MQVVPAPANEAAPVDSIPGDPEDQEINPEPPVEVEVQIINETEEPQVDETANTDEQTTEPDDDETDGKAAPLFAEQREAEASENEAPPVVETESGPAQETVPAVDPSRAVPEEPLPQRPFAVMVENEPPARPQSGLWRAAVVYEIVAEEITRFMPIYLDGSDETEIGPVRSARDYFADISTFYDAIYVHCGGSPRGLAFIRKTPVDDIDAIRGDRGFYRTRDRRIPHNLYVKLSSLPKEADRKKFRRTTQLPCPFLFRETPWVTEGTVECPLFTIPYYRSYQVSWRWRSLDGVYRREHKGKEFLSKDGQHPHDSENVIIHRIPTRMIDNQMRHEMDLWAGGTCEVFIGGERVSGTWQRERDGRIAYFNRDHEEIRFNPGRIWIQFAEPKLELMYGEEPPKSKKKKK